MEVTFLRKSMTAVGPLWCTTEKYRAIGTLANSRHHTSPRSAEEKMNNLVRHIPLLASFKVINMSSLQRGQFGLEMEQTILVPMTCTFMLVLLQPVCHAVTCSARDTHQTVPINYTTVEKSYLLSLLSVHHPSSVCWLAVQEIKELHDQQA